MLTPCSTILRFNAEFNALAKRKHADADRVADLNTRLDDLGRELAKLALTGATAAATAAGATAADGAQQPGSPGGAGSAGSVAAEGERYGGGRVAVRWAGIEDLEDTLFKVKPEEIQVRGSGLGSVVLELLSHTVGTRAFRT